VHAVEKSPPFCPVNGEQEYRVANLRIGHNQDGEFESCALNLPDVTHQHTGPPRLGWVDNTLHLRGQRIDAL